MRALVEVFEEIGNRFNEDSGDLLTLDTKLIMDSEVHKIVERRTQWARSSMTFLSKKGLLIKLSQLKTQSRKTNSMCLPEVHRSKILRLQQ